MNDNDASSNSPAIDARLWGAAVVVFLAAALRIVPHPPNFSPIAAMALFGGAYLSRKVWALILPLAAMLLADFAIGFHDQMPAVYGAFLLVTLIGFTLKDKASLSRLAGASLASSVLFFVITNISVWASGGMYEHSAQGLATCFVAALPFFQNSLVGDLFFSGVLFGGWALLSRAIPQLREA